MASNSTDVLVGIRLNFTKGGRGGGKLIQRPCIALNQGTLLWRMGGGV